MAGFQWFRIGPIWSQDGRELFYQTRGDAGAVRMMAVTIETEPTLSPGNPVTLFEGPYRLGELTAVNAFDVSADGQRFLMVKRGSAGDQLQIIVVQN